MRTLRFLHRASSVGLTLLAASCSSSAQPTSADPEPPTPGGAVIFDFEADVAGSVPAGFSSSLTGGGGDVKWIVEEVPDAPSGQKVVAQRSADRTNYRFPHLVRDDFAAKDVDLAVRFKTLSGEVDASAGLVWRFESEADYYVVRANSLEDNVVAYKMEGGKRENIGVKGLGDVYGVEIDVPHQEWNTLRLIARGNLFEIFLNGRKIFEVEDDTFAGAGRVGLWTKADAVTQFDDFRVKALD